MPSGTDTPEDCFLVYAWGFAARYVDTAQYGPPYFLRGNSRCCFTTFDSGPSSVLSWPVRHRFAAAKAAQLVLECYGRSGSGVNELIGVCLAQMHDLVAACAKDSVMTLHMRHGSNSKGEVSFRVGMQRLFTLTLRATRIAIEPSSLQPSLAYVKLSVNGRDEWDGGSCVCCGRGTSSSIKSELLRNNTGDRVVLPLLQWRSTLTGNAGSVDGEIYATSGGSLGHFSIVFPDAVVAALLNGESSSHFAFSAPVKAAAAGLRALFSCVGEVTVLTDCPMLTLYCGTSASPAGNVTNSLSGVERSILQGVSGVWPSGLSLLDSVLHQQQGRLVQIRENIEWVRKSKGDIEQKLEELKCREASRNSGASIGSSMRRDIEKELHACLERRRILEDALTRVRQRRDAAKGEYLSHSKERAQELQAFLEEDAHVQRMLEDVGRTQSKLRSFVSFEDQMEERMQRFATEQQELDNFDANVLECVRQLRKSFS
ncbi:hypothetical protein DPX39_110067700 [Trypanosoma brucei equiperdum]|uniref:Uncharacterized protein n=1 Tax=Trypanosoma brucei equiperdum TaxID=630700 RepID=A0A3L6KZQ2_9TRYP|nr:hypothetical protein DPX39_110067700 [Trypanosoma brucei equiperdum]